MDCSLNKKELCEYVQRQCDMLFPDGQDIERDLNNVIGEALLRTKVCFSNINNKYFYSEGHTCFNHLNGDQYSMFLYFLCNSLFKNTVNVASCSKIYLLNKALFGIDVFYEVELPEVFVFTHPVGTVLGRAEYSDYFAVYQGCNVGSNKGKYPTIGKRCTLHPFSSILGDCMVGDNVRIATRTTLIDSNIPKNTICVNSAKELIFKSNSGVNDFWR